jgi:UDP-glucose-4-epimerase GalE
MKVLVAGGAGYIGSHTCKALAEAGYEPVVVDNLSTGHRSAVKWGPLEIGSIGDAGFMGKIFRTYEIDAVIHFAASAYVGESMTNPIKYFKNNIVETLNMFEVMEAFDIKKIVFSSTCATYGVPDQIPINEDNVTNPKNPYGETKLVVEQSLKWLGELRDWNWVALRYFNAAGADPDGEIGELHFPETHLIPLVLQAALGKSGTLSVYGTDYPTRDGTAIRDYVHVSDLAQAHVLALQHINQRPVNDFFNLGTGVGASVQEVIDVAEALVHKKVPYINASRRAGDPPELVASCTKAKEILGWVPTRSGLDQIVIDAIRWERRQAREIFI